MAGLAVNVGANSTLPGFRGPIHDDGSFVYVPIPERRSTRVPVPTYADLDLPVTIDQELLDTPVHLDPTFGNYPRCSTYTYGDEHGVKATPIGELDANDYLFFYATLESAADNPPQWMPPRWGAYVIGHHRLAEPPLVDGHERDLTDDERERYAENAHLKRERMDARVLVRGDPDESALYREAIPLSDSEAGGEPGPFVLEHSTDSGRGPWWRRPLRFPDVSPLLTARNRRNR